MQKLILAFLLVSFPIASNAEIYIEGGARAGNDKLRSEEVTCVDIFFQETSCARGFRIGGGVHLAVGYDYLIGDNDSEALSLALGYLWESSFEEKTSATTLEAIYTQHHDLHRLGIGLAYHLDPKYEEEINDFNTIRLDFDDALGIVFKYGYLIRQPDWLLGVRYTIMDYETDGEEVDASSLGIYVSKSFQ